MQTLGETFVQRGAQVGGVWIALLVITAVAAPFIATTFPYYVRYADGTSASPLLQHLSPMDVTLSVAFLAGLVLYFVKRWSAGRRTMIVIGLAVATFIGASAVSRLAGGKLFHPMEGSYYSIYREQAAADKITYALWAPIPYSPGDRLRDIRGVTHPLAPSAEHPLGTGGNGSSVLSNMIHASRIALTVGFISTGIAIAIGIVIGGVMGYFAGWVDLFGMRLVEIVSAIPTIFLLLAFVAFFPGDPQFSPFGLITITIPRLYMIMAILGVTGWIGYARFIRAEFLKLRQQDFVIAARACGLPLRSILFRHMLPNGVTPVLVMASFGVAGAILTEATLSFLGLGLDEEPSWGTLLSQASASTGGFHWWLAIYPGAAIFLTVFAYNLIGEAMRDVIDPHTRQK